jgi:hypothetical protein
MIYLKPDYRDRLIGIVPRIIDENSYLASFKKKLEASVSNKAGKPPSRSPPLLKPLRRDSSVFDDVSV